MQGTEIKSIRRGSANLKDSYAQVKNGEMYLNNMHIAPYEEGNRFNHDPLRSRKLLHKREIIKLGDQTREIGYSIVPLKLYLKHGHCKVLLGVARGKKNMINVNFKRKSSQTRCCARYESPLLSDLVA